MTMTKIEIGWKRPKWKWNFYKDDNENNPKYKNKKYIFKNPHFNIYFLFNIYF